MRRRLGSLSETFTYSTCTGRNIVRWFKSHSVIDGIFCYKKLVQSLNDFEFAKITELA